MKEEHPLSKLVVVLHILVFAKMGVVKICENMVFKGMGVLQMDSFICGR